MDKDRKSQKTNAPWQMGMPVLEMMFDSDMPSTVFQPLKAMSLGQIEMSALINRRLQACAELPHQLATCRTPQDMVNLNMAFFQTALKDYAQAVTMMAEAWEKALQQQDGFSPPMSEARAHDYLSLPSDQPDDKPVKAMPNGPREELDPHDDDNVTRITKHNGARPR